jgi:hypothetical protein
MGQQSLRCQGRAGEQTRDLLVSIYHYFTDEPQRLPPKAKIHILFVRTIVVTFCKFCVYIRCRLENFGHTELATLQVTASFLETDPGLPLDY